MVALQVAVSAVMFVMFFRLQQVGGPTCLGQVGYVAAAVGVGVGVGVGPGFAGLDLQSLV